MQSSAIVVSATGGSEKLVWHDIDLPAPGANEVLIEHKAIGLNFIDIYQRSGVNPMPLPFTPGQEAAGVVLEVGEGVDDFRPGDRVAYCTAPLGAYSRHRVIDARYLIPLPDHVDDETAAGVLLKGLTADYLIHRTYPVKAGETVLLHAAAGGVGTIMTQWLNKTGATLIGTVGSAQKADYAQANGCHHTIIYTQEDVVQRVQDLTQGQGVPVVYDSVGKATIDISFDCLQNMGYLVCFGNASGIPAPIPLMKLVQKGSVFLTRPSLAHYCKHRVDLLAGAERLFSALDQGLAAHIEQRFPLAQVGRAHDRLANRNTTGSTVLIP